MTGFVRRLLDVFPDDVEEESNAGQTGLPSVQRP